MSAARRLLTLYEDIERRARATTEAHPWWPCRRGCGGCCQRLADIPRLTRAEWLLLRQGIDALDPHVRGRVIGRIAELERLSANGELPRHVTCPMLEATEARDEGTCLVYQHRPAACRTYGFYARRADDLCCDLVVEAVDHQDARESVVWGNHDGIDHALGCISGEPLPLTEWAVQLRPSSST